MIVAMKLYDEKATLTGPPVLNSGKTTGVVASSSLLYKKSILSKF